MKHAYLILAHNEFPVLEFLIKALDDARNDIFIHFDEKVEAIPVLETKYATLNVLKDRKDVRWGDVSVVEAEYILFEAASKRGSYDYYHLISGVDMPLRPQEDIHAFFEVHNGKEFIGFSSGNLEKELDRKVQRYHLYPKQFRATGIGLRRLVRYAFLRAQYAFGIRRNRNVEFKKGTQWISVTEDFVKYLISKKEEVLQTYQNTFCADEIFVQTLCWHSPFKEKVFDPQNEGRGCKRMIGWQNSQLIEWTEDDFETLVQSEALFARKFSSSQIGLVKKVFSYIKR